MHNKLKNYKNSTKTKFWVPSLLISLCYNESIKVKRNEANRNRKKEDFFMKKTLAVVLSAVMVSGLALSGCGGNSTSATTAAPKETTTAAPAETKKEETKKEETKGEAASGEQVTITMSNWLEAEEAQTPPESGHTSLP